MRNLRRPFYFQYDALTCGSGFADLMATARSTSSYPAGQPAEVWENIGADGKNWIILKLVGVRSTRDGIGTAFASETSTNHMTSVVSYASSSPAGVHFGPAKIDKISRIEVRWPRGVTQTLTDVKPNQELIVREP